MQYFLPTFLITLGLLIVASSFITIIETGEIATVERIGKLREDVILDPGPHFKLPLADKINRISTRVREDEFAANPEFIDRTEGNVLPGKKEPIRILHKGTGTAVFYVERDKDVPLTKWDKVDFETYLDRTSPKEKASGSVIDPGADLPVDQKKRAERKKSIENDPLQQPITTEVQFVVEWQISEEEAIKFVRNVGSEETALKRMEDTVSRALQEFLGPTTAGHASEVMSHVSSIIEERIQILVGQIEDPELVKANEEGTKTYIPCDEEGDKNKRPSWGVKVINAYIKSINPGRTINLARNEAAKAVADKVKSIEASEARAEDVRLLSEANAKKDVLNARAQKKVKKLEGEGEAERLGAIAEKVATPEGKFILQNETARQVLTNAKAIVMPSDLGAIGGILSLGEEFRKKQSTPPE